MIPAIAAASSALAILSDEDEPVDPYEVFCRSLLVGDIEGFARQVIDPARESWSNEGLTREEIGVRLKQLVEYLVDVVRDSPTIESVASGLTFVAEIFEAYRHEIARAKFKKGSLNFGSFFDGKTPVSFGGGRPFFVTFPSSMSSVSWAHEKIFQEVRGHLKRGDEVFRADMSQFDTPLAYDEHRVVVCRGSSDIELVSKSELERVTGSVLADEVTQFSRRILSSRTIKSIAIHAIDRKGEVWIIKVYAPYHDPMEPAATFKPAATDLESLRDLGLKRLGIPKRAGVGVDIGEWRPFTPEGSDITGWTWDNPRWNK